MPWQVPIYDRTEADVKAKADKCYFSAAMLNRIEGNLAYLADLWSGSRSYADGGDWPIVWESAGIWLRHDWPYYLFYLVLIVGGLLLARRLKKRGEA